MTPLWSRRPEGSVRWAIRGYVWCVRRIGRPLARVTLLPISLYFLIVRGPERRASRTFLSRALGRPAHMSDVLRNFWTFSQVVLDRVYLLGDLEPRLDVRAQDVEILGAALEQGRGCLLVGSHLGSFEAGRIVSRQRPEVNLRILMDRSVNPNTTGMLETLNPDLARQIIDVSEHRGTLALRIGEALSQGDLVAVLGDRVTEDERSVRVDFLGSKASFPLAPFLLAAATHAPVVLFFGLYEGSRRYRVVFEALACTPSRRGERLQQIEAVVQAYADRLAHYARAAPYNWFNFYPFWEEGPA